MLSKLIGTLAVMVVINSPTVTMELEHKDELGTIMQAILPHLHLPSCKRLLSNLQANADDLTRMLNAQGGKRSYDLDRIQVRIVNRILQYLEPENLDSFKNPSAASAIDSNCVIMNIYIGVEESYGKDKPAGQARDAYAEFHREYPNFHWAEFHR